jgi:predicted SAM-dependent methyltransferase
MKKVNLGCGTSIATSWINIDSSFNITLSKFPILKKVLFKSHIIPKPVCDSQFPSNIIRHDLTKGLPFESDSIDYIYSSHLLEHLERSDSEKFLAECHRVLKKGGIFRLVVPDLKLITTKYVNGVINADQFIQLLQLNEFNSNKTLAERFLPFFFTKDVHKWMFDFESLNDLLKIAGFEKVEKMNFQVGKVPDIKILDNRPELSLYLEAQK